MRREKQALTGSGRERVGSTEHGTTGLDSIETFNDHSYNGSREHIFDEAWEEWLAGKILVVYKDMGTQRTDRGHLERVKYTLGYTGVTIYGCDGDPGRRTYAFRGAPWKEWPSGGRRS